MFTINQRVYRAIDDGESDLIEAFPPPSPPPPKRISCRFFHFAPLKKLCKNELFSISCRFQDYIVRS